MMCVSSEPAISREFVNKFADGNLLRDLQFECRGASKFSVAAIWLQQWACPFPSPTVSGECCKLPSGFEQSPTAKRFFVSQMGSELILYANEQKFYEDY